MGGHDKLMLPACKLQRQLIPQPVGFLRRDLAGPERLDDEIGDHVLLRGALASGVGGIDLLADRKLLPCRIRLTLVSRYQQAALCFLRIFVIVQPFPQHGGDAAALTGMTGFNFGYCHICPPIV